MSGKWRVRRIPGDILGWWHAVEPPCPGRDFEVCHMKPTWRAAYNYAYAYARPQKTMED